MLADARYSRQDKSFWAHVRTIGQAVGYTRRGESQILIPSQAEIVAAYTKLGLSCGSLFSADGRATARGQLLLDYFEHRARLLHDSVRPNLMDAGEARDLFDDLSRRLCPKCPLPMNKQKGEKKAPAYLTGLVNMLIEANADGLSCDHDPRELTTVRRGGEPLRTLARRVDGAFPAVVDPIAVWEIKEYYYTTTFGSRVADGVYESLLDGMELEELREHEGINVLHYLMIDARYTWWDCGKSYLCRIVDMLHMGYVDEVLVGREVVTRLPDIVRTWVDLERARRIR